MHSALIWTLCHVIAAAAAAAAAACLQTSLANWWNVFDAFNVWRTYRVRMVGAPAAAKPVASVELGCLLMWVAVHVPVKSLPSAAAAAECTVTGT
jgi:hypothetical protein